MAKTYIVLGHIHKTLRDALQAANPKHYENTQPSKPIEIWENLPGKRLSYRERHKYDSLGDWLCDNGRYRGKFAYTFHPAKEGTQHHEAL